MTEQESDDSGTCPKQGCPKKTLLNMPKLGPDDTVFILFHGNAKVRLKKLEFHYRHGLKTF